MTFIELSELLGNIGEFVGSVAVLVTLIYLAVQVRHSKELLETNSSIALGQVSQTNSSFRLDIQRYLAEPRILELRAKVEAGDAVYSQKQKDNFDQLTPAEKLLWKSIQAQFAIMHDEGLYQASLGHVDSKDREILERGVKQSMPYWRHFDSYVPSRLRNWYDAQQNH